VLHLLFNLISFLSIARRMERDMGSTRFGCVMFLLSNMVAFVYLTIAFLSRYIFYQSSLFESCVVGFSGVLFALVVVFVYQFSVSEAVMLAGVIPVPSTAYPWLLLFIFQFLPNVSFVCHLSGLLVGFAFVHGLLRPLHLSTSAINRIEHVIFIRALSQYNGFVPNTESRLPTTATNPTSPSATATAGASSTGASNPVPAAATTI
jgi:membrane associated rhomboid family serine protease